MKHSIIIDLNQQLLDQIRTDNSFLTKDLNDEELTEMVVEFLNDINSPTGLSLVLENLDFFNC